MACKQQVLAGYCPLAYNLILLSYYQAAQKELQIEKQQRRREVSRLAG